MASFASWAAVCAIAASAALTAQDTPDRNADAEAGDIVVIAQKLRKVRLTYAVRGGAVTRCTPSGGRTDPRIGRIMCAILRACVAEGAVDVEPAGACMRRRIDSLDALPPQPVTTIAAVPQQGAPGPASGAPQTVARPSPGADDVVVTAPRQQEDIVTLGRSPMLRAGLWRFDRSATLSLGGGGASRSIGYSICVDDGALEQLLRDAAKAQAFLAGSQICGGLKLSVGQGRIDGRRSCTKATTLPSRLSIKGRYDAQQVTINYLEEQDHDGLETGSAGWNPARPTAQRWRVLAHRQGSCPARPRLDQRLERELAGLLFSNAAPEN